MRTRGLMAMTQTSQNVHQESKRVELGFLSSKRGQNGTPELVILRLVETVKIVFSLQRELDFEGQRGSKKGGER